MLRLLTRPAVRAVRPAVLRRMAPRAAVAAVAPRRWMAGGHAAPAAAAHDSHGHAAAGSYGGGHGHGHGPAWAAATEHERVERDAATLRAIYRADYTLAGQRGDEPSHAEPTAEELKQLRETVAKLPKHEEDGTEYVMEKCEDGIERPDFVPSRSITTRTIEMDGETIVVPELHATLDWVMSSPMDFHTFEEVPAIKDAPEHDHHEDNTKDE